MTNFTDKFRMKSTGMSPEELADLYSNWAEKYDKDMAECKARAPSILADEMVACFSRNRHQIKIMDVACGTGRIGEELAANGFTNIDGLDSSTGMLEQCKGKGHYNTLYKVIISGDNTLPIQDDIYDCLVVAGGIGGSHIPCSGVLEMIRIVKPGGLILIVMRKEYEDSDGEFVDEMDIFVSMIESKNMADLIERREVSKYYLDRDGILFKIRVK